MTDGINVKIGYTARSLKQRIKELNTGSASHIYPLGYIGCGDLELEKQLHKRFIPIHGEWFKATDDLLQFINTWSDMDVYVDWLDGKLITYKMIRCV